MLSRHNKQKNYMHIIKMFNLPLQARFVAAPLMLIAFCFAIQYFNLIALFEYDRALILFCKANSGA